MNYELMKGIYLMEQIIFQVTVSRNRFSGFLIDQLRILILPIPHWNVLLWFTPEIQKLWKGEKQKIHSGPFLLSMFLQDSQRLMPQLQWALSFPRITHMSLPSDFLRKASCKPSGILKSDGDTVQLIFLRELSSSSGKLSFPYTTTYTQFFQTNKVSFREYTSHDKTIKRSKAMINLKVWRKGSIHTLWDEEQAFKTRLRTCVIISKAKVLTSPFLASIPTLQ